MKNKKVLLALCAVLLVAATVFGTLAYLTSTDEVINTFTVGKVEITLDEAPVNENGQKIEGARVKENSYKLIPGRNYAKDPTVHVAEGSETCYVFVKVENGIADIEDINYTIADQLRDNGWELLDGETDVYYKANVEAGVDLIVFDGFIIDGEVDSNTLATYAGKTITVTAYAVQANGFTSAADAWDATFGADA